MKRVGDKIEHENGATMKTQNLLGERFGNLVVIQRGDDYINKKGKHIPMWLCRCDCGNTKIVSASNLKTGNVKSCGCMHHISKDLTGQRFGMLTIIKRDEDYVDPKGKHRITWRCRCDCGTITTVSAGNLKAGKTQSCGCLNRKAKDLTGQKFGSLTVIERADDQFDINGKRRIMWRCRCDCGNEKITSTYCLQSGTTKSCGCYTKIQDLVGRKFGKLTVIQRGPDRTNGQGARVITWTCQCDCGNTATILASNIKNAKSCGQCISLLDDLTGQRFGSLTVIRRAEDKIGSNGMHSTMWWCRCDCGNEKAIASHNLKKGTSTSCGNCNQTIRLGKTCVSRCGLKATITKYNNNADVEITLEDGTVCKNEYRKVKDGGPFYPEGMTKYLKAENYHGYTNLSFAFRLKDGSVYFYCTTPEGEEDVLTLQQMYHNHK